MGTIFEELLRKFNEQTNENPGEHFTPREVIRLMVRLVVNGDREILEREGVVRSVYDPACGTGGMLSIAEDYVQESINPTADIRLYGQEINDETYAVCVSDMLIKGDEDDAQNTKSRSSLSHDGHRGTTFDYMISKMKAPEEGGSRIAIVLNGSPLFTGGAGSGESEIRRWILENDWLETIVSLPTQLFYNTGIATYVWVLTNRKDPERRGKVLLVNGAATEKVGGKEAEVFARKMRKSLGDKRNELGEDHVDRLVDLSTGFREDEYARIFQTTDFGYRRITVERPLRLSFVASPERIDRLRDEKAFQSLATTKKKDMAGEIEAEAGKSQQAAIVAALKRLDPNRLYMDREEFRPDLDVALREAGVKVGAPVKKAIISALSERDPEAEVCKDRRGNSEPDPELRDSENVPLKEDVYDYFGREVLPHVPDAWIDESVCDHKDGGVGKVGYEINFNRHFYRYVPPRPLEEIDAEIKAVEAEILEMLNEVTT
jgi:type I restriction enzyme M protein